MQARFAFAVALTVLAPSVVALADDAAPPSASSGVNNQSINVSNGSAVVVTGNQQVTVSPTGDISLNGTPVTLTACPAAGMPQGDGSTVSVESNGRTIQLQGGILTITSGGQSMCLDLGAPGQTSTTPAPPAVQPSASLSTPQVGPGVSLVGQSLQGQSLAGRDLHGSDLTGADLHGLDLSNANLAGATLVGADLSGAHLASADLTQADLVGTDLSAADLRGAHLTSANVTGARFASAHLEGTDLTGVTSAAPNQFRDAIVDAATKLPGR